MPDVQTLPQTADEADRLLEMGGGDEAPQGAEPELVVETTHLVEEPAAQPRDERGRFASPAPAVPTAPEAATPEVLPTGEQVADTPVAPEVPAEPFAYEADNQSQVIEG